MNFSREFSIFIYLFSVVFCFVPILGTLKLRSVGNTYWFWIFFCCDIVNDIQYYIRLRDLKIFRSIQSGVDFAFVFIICNFSYIINVFPRLHFNRVHNFFVYETWHEWVSYGSMLHHTCMDDNIISFHFVLLVSLKMLGFGGRSYMCPKSRPFTKINSINVFSSPELFHITCYSDIICTIQLLRVLWTSYLKIDSLFFGLHFSVFFVSLFHDVSSSRHVIYLDRTSFYSCLFNLNEKSCLLKLLCSVFVQLIKFDSPFFCVFSVDCCQLWEICQTSECYRKRRHFIIYMYNQPCHFFPTILRKFESL